MSAVAIPGLVGAGDAPTLATIRTRLRAVRLGLEAMIDPNVFEYRLSAALDAVADLDQTVALAEAAERSRS